MGVFVQDIEEFVRKTNVGPDLVLRKIGIDALRNCLFHSPVDTGRFRGNWRLGVNRVDLTVDEDGGASAGARPNSDAQDSEIAEGLSEIATAEFGDQISVTNNLPYAAFLEDGGSDQFPGPDAVLGAAFDVTASTFREVVEAVRKAL